MPGRSLDSFNLYLIRISVRYTNKRGSNKCAIKCELYIMQDMSGRATVSDVNDLPPSSAWLARCCVVGCFQIDLSHHPDTCSTTGPVSSINSGEASAT